jgi:hypothetical protein
MIWTMSVVFKDYISPWLSRPTGLRAKPGSQACSGVPRHLKSPSAVPQRLSKLPVVSLGLDLRQLRCEFAKQEGLFAVRSGFVED